MQVGVLTISDAGFEGGREDRSGALIEAWLQEQGHGLARRALVPDDALTITRTLLDWADSGEVSAIVTTGGTGFAPRDVTPEATRPVLDREAPGVAERLRRAGEVNTRWASTSRGLVGLRGHVVIVNLPGSPGGVRDGLAVLSDMLPHLTALAQGEHPDHRPPGGALPPDHEAAP